MKIKLKASSAMSLAETMLAVGLIGGASIAIYSLLTSGLVLGAKNTAMNTAHQQARVAMLQMVQDLHSSVSLPQLADENGNPPPPTTPSPQPSNTPIATPTATPTPAAGISFYLWRIGPLRVAADANPGDTTIQVIIPPGVEVPVVDPSPAPRPRLVVQGHGVEEDIVAVSGVTGTAGGTATFTLARPLPTASPPTFQGVKIAGSTSRIVCFVADRCSYAVKNVAPSGQPPQLQLQWRGPSNRSSLATMATGMTNPTPFTVKISPKNAPLYQIVAAFDLSTADPSYSNRGFKSSNILLKGEVPIRARLMDKQ